MKKHAGIITSWLDRFGNGCLFSSVKRKTSKLRDHAEETWQTEKIDPDKAWFISILGLKMSKHKIEICLRI